MNDFTSKLINTLIQNGNITELFRTHVEEAVNKLLLIELTEFLDYEKYDRTGFNSGNSHNGYYERHIKTEYGDLNIKVPRDRNGEFTSQTISNITQAVVEDLGLFNQRRLNERYAVVYLDATYLAVRRDTVTKETLYFAIGITPEGYKEILT
ncbi:Transposase and inactivated derivatives [Acholeplasma oculi]|uniref:Mutator family transposase n=1 Tax=Acholeplasma oculi TaxID=35623 RepID=A0A061AFD5_9MOLU|nr:Transposase, mutator type [Acholeplasma oculi]SKC43899.1 Transposase and inactivated derivatives [Acholeplasma oculi]SUT88587.1 Transposase and inactivated derivatives [Acholeplasma oculi]